MPHQKCRQKPLVVSITTKAQAQHWRAEHPQYVAKKKKQESSERQVSIQELTGGQEFLAMMKKLNQLTQVALVIPSPPPSSSTEKCQQLAVPSFGIASCLELSLETRVLESDTRENKSEIKMIRRKRRRRKRKQWKTSFAPRSSIVVVSNDHPTNHPMKKEDETTIVQPTTDLPILHPPTIETPGPPAIVMANKSDIEHSSQAEESPSIGSNPSSIVIQEVPEVVQDVPTPRVVMVPLTTLSSRTEETEKTCQRLCHEGLVITRDIKSWLVESQYFETRNTRDSEPHY